jgi:uncharacterized protein YukE
MLQLQFEQELAEKKRALEELREALREARERAAAAGAEGEGADTAMREGA